MISDYAPSNLSPDCQNASPNSVHLDVDVDVDIDGDMHVDETWVRNRPVASYVYDNVAVAVAVNVQVHDHVDVHVM